MKDNEVVIEQVDEHEVIFDFLRAICVRYHLDKDDPSFSQREFIDWIVLRAGLLYIEYVLQPESTHC